MGMTRQIISLCICLFCICGSTPAEPADSSEGIPFSFPSLVEKNQARTTLSLALAALKSGRTEQLPSLFHPFEVFIHGQGWQPAEAAQQLLMSRPESSIPPVGSYTLHSLREIAENPILKKRSENLFQVLDQRGVIALVAAAPHAPVFYLSRENSQDPWTICGLDTSRHVPVQQTPMIPDSWEMRRSPVCSGSLPVPRGWRLHTAPAGEPDQFLAMPPDSPPAIRIDSREFNGPISEFSLNWIRMILLTGNIREARIRLVRNGFRVDFSWALGKGVLGILSRNERLLFFSICFDNDPGNSVQSMITRIFSAWNTAPHHSGQE